MIVSFLCVKLLVWLAKQGVRFFDLSMHGCVRALNRSQRAWYLCQSVMCLKLGAAVLGKADVAQRLLGSLQVDIAKNHQLLGWTPPVSVDAALKQVAITLR